MKIDEDDFKDRPRMKKSWRHTPWSPKLGELIRNYIVRDHERDYFWYEDVAEALQAKPDQVRACMASLSRGGLLSWKRVPHTDPDGNPYVIRIGFERITMYKGKWHSFQEKWVKGTNGRKRKSTWEKVYHPTTWCGMAHYVIRSGEPYKAARRDLGLAEDPFKDPWSCTCGTVNENAVNEDRCGKCYALRSTCEVKPTPPVKHCKRCDAVIKNRRTHPRAECSSNVVRSVLDV